MIPVENKPKKHTLNPNLWVKNYADFLFNYGITRVSDPIVVEDLVQDTFLAAVKSSKNFKGEASEKTWITSIFKRKIVDHYRKMNSKKGRFETPMYKLGEERREVLEATASVSVDFSDKEIEQTELGTILDSCIADLRGNQYKVFVMKTIQGMDTEEICNELDLSPSNVWVLLHRARVQLKECVNKKWYKN